MTVTGNGNYTTPAGAAPAQASTYWWTASYSGDANNNTAAIRCGDEQVTITNNAPSAYLYWTILDTNPSAGPVSEANLDGSNPQAIVSGQQGPTGWR